MTYVGADKGMFVYGNIYGSFSFENDPDGSGPCTAMQLIEKPEALQLAFKLYAEAGGLVVIL